MIPPHIESIPSLLVIKVHKVVLSVVYHVVLFLACVACSAVRSGRKKEGDWGESILEAKGDINIKRLFTLSFHPSPFFADHAGSGSFITKGLENRSSSNKAQLLSRVS